MRLVTYSADDGQGRVGAVEGGMVYPVADLGEDMISFIERGLERKPSAEGATLESVRLHAPVQNPQKIIAIGLNYGDHAEETGGQIPEKPIVFAKYPSAVVGTGEPIHIPPITQQGDYEAELGVVIGSRAKNVTASRALEYVYGYLNFNDVSSRDLQFSEGGQWTRSKSLDTFAPMGPYLVTRDEVPDPQNLHVRSLLNGEVMQDGNTSRMIFPVAELIAFLSGGMTLVPGDVIATGTPAGVGVARDPKVFLKEGDEIIVEVEGLGTLSNPVVEGSG